MPSAKIEFKVGPFSFAGEGDEAWLAKQLDKILEKASDLRELAAETDPTGDSKLVVGGDLAKTTLASYLTSKNAVKNQTMRFLATAAWLQQRGSKRLKPGDVANALKQNNQSRLGNPSDCLGKNINKGYCEKDGAHFFVTDEGLKHLK